MMKQSEKETKTKKNQNQNQKICRKLSKWVHNDYTKTAFNPHINGSGLPGSGKVVISMKPFSNKLKSATSKTKMITYMRLLKADCDQITTNYLIAHNRPSSPPPKSIISCAGTIFLVSASKPPSFAFANECKLPDHLQ